MRTYGKNHGETLDTTHVRGFEVTLHSNEIKLNKDKKELDRAGNTYHTNEVLIPHLLDGDVLD